MPWNNGIYTDFFTTEEREQIKIEIEPLFPGYFSITDFESIVLDGDCSLTILREIVTRLEIIQQHREASRSPTDAGGVGS